MRSFLCFVLAAIGVGSGFRCAAAEFPAPSLTYLENHGGGALELHAGAYVTTTGYDFTESVDLILQGQGYNSTTLSVSGARAVGLSLGTAGTDVTQDISLRDLGVVGSNNSGTNILLNSLHAADVDRIRTSRSGGDGLEAVRSYATSYRSLYSNNNAGSGFHASSPVGGMGNDNLLMWGGHLLANGQKGFWSQGQLVGGLIAGTDIEGNAVGLEIDGGFASTSYSNTILSAYFEQQIGQNLVIGNDQESTIAVPAFTMIGTIFNPGRVSADVNEALLDRVRSGFLVDNHFSTVNLAITGNASRLLVGPNEYSTAVGPWQPGANPRGYKEPVLYQISYPGPDFGYGLAPQGWKTRAFVGEEYSGDTLDLSENVSVRARGIGTQFDSRYGSSDIDLGSDEIAMYIAAAGSEKMEKVLDATNAGTAIPKLITPVSKVADLPPCNKASDGMRLFVMDSTLPGRENFGAPVIGKGPNHVPVYCDSIGWKIG